MSRSALPPNSISCIKGEYCVQRMGSEWQCAPSGQEIQLYTGVSDQMHPTVQHQACLTHPLSIQQQVDFEDHAVVDRDFLVSVKDLEYPAEDGAVVNPCRAEAAFLWWGTTKKGRCHWCTWRTKLSWWICLMGLHKPVMMNEEWSVCSYEAGHSRRLSLSDL